MQGSCVVSESLSPSCLDGDGVLASNSITLNMLQNGCCQRCYKEARAEGAVHD